MTKEEIYCGTKEEILEYINSTYNLVERNKDTMELLGANFMGGEGCTYPSIKDQIEQVIGASNKTGLILFLTNKAVDLKGDIPEITLEFTKIWIHIRKDKKEKE